MGGDQAPLPEELSACPSGSRLLRRGVEGCPLSPAQPTLLSLAAPSCNRQATVSASPQHLLPGPQLCGEVGASGPAQSSERGRGLAAPHEATANSSEPLVSLCALENCLPHGSVPLQRVGAGVLGAGL